MWPSLTAHLLPENKSSGETMSGLIHNPGPPALLEAFPAAIVVIKSVNF